MQVIIRASIKTVPVLVQPFKGRLSLGDAQAILATFEADGELVIAEAIRQQKNGTVFGSARIGNAVVSTNNSRTMVSRITEERAEERAKVESVKQAAELVRAIHGCDVVANEGGKRTRLSAEGRIITCGTANPFTAEQVAASVPALFTLADNRGGILATVI